VNRSVHFALAIAEPNGLVHFIKPKLKAKSMTRIFAPTVIAMSLIAAPALAFGVVVDFPTLTYPSSETVDTSRDFILPFQPGR